ncbi:MAG: NHL repeat-containing protein [Polyangia bacterium]
MRERTGARGPMGHHSSNRSRPGAFGVAVVAALGVAVAGWLAAACDGPMANRDDLGAGGEDLGASGGADLGAGGGDLGASTGPIELVAGLPGGSGNLDQIGAAARFSSAFSITFDAGALYVAETGGVPRIRKVATATAAVTTLPGSTIAVHLVAGGAGTLYYISGGAFGGGAQIARLVLATNTSTPLAGGTAVGSSDGTGAAARFSGPSGLAWDGAGTLYVADTGNHTIRKVVVATGAVTTIAGTAGTAGSADGTGSAALFRSPQGLATDGSGNLYIADTNNRTIRKLVLATGAVTTLAGSPGLIGTVDGVGSAARFADPSKLVWDGAGNLYVAALYTLRKVAVATGTVTTLAGNPQMPGSTDGTGTAARFNYVEDLAWDGAGSLYTADIYSVRKVAVATGAVTTLAGMSANAGSSDGVRTAARFSGPSGSMAWDGAGSLYVPDTVNSRVRKIDLATGAVSTLQDGTGAPLSVYRPAGLTWDGAGSLYAVTGPTVARIVVESGAMTTLAGTMTMTGSSDGIGAAARFRNPQGVTWDGAGNLYVADTDNQTIRQIVIATGAVTTLAGTAGTTGLSDGTGAAARFTSPSDLVSDRSGNLYVADLGNPAVRKIVTATGVVTTVQRDTTHYPQSIAYDGAGNLYVGDVGRTLPIGTVRKIALATGTATTVIGVEGELGLLPGAYPGRLNGPRGLVWVPQQGLAISDAFENCVLLARGL